MQSNFWAGSKNLYRYLGPVKGQCIRAYRHNIYTVVTLVLTSLNLDLVQTFLAASRARSGLVHSTGPSLMHLAYRSTEPGEFFFALLNTLHFFNE